MVSVFVFSHLFFLFWGFAAQTLEILQRPGSYEKLEALSKRMVEGILAAAHDAGHEASGGYIRGMFGFFFNKGPVNNFTDAAKSDSGLCVCVCGCAPHRENVVDHSELSLFFFVFHVWLRWFSVATTINCLGFLVLARRPFVGLRPVLRLGMHVSGKVDYLEYVGVRGCATSEVVGDARRVLGFQHDRVDILGLVALTDFAAVIRTSRQPYYE